MKSMIDAESDANKGSSEDALRQGIEVKAFAFRELAAATDHFTPYNLVGEGGFFRVYKGQLEKNGQVNTIPIVLSIITYVHCTAGQPKCTSKC
jgi:hypothetical protein